MRLSRRHDGYNALKRRVAWLEASYLGGEAYKALRLLRSHPREAPEDYNDRLEHAYYANYVARVVDAYVSEVFRRKPSRELSGGRFEAFVSDATLAGDALTDFCRDVLTWALASDVAYVGVDLDGELPYVHRIHPDNVLDFSVDRRGSFRWAMIAERVVADDEPDEMRRVERRVRLWTRESWTLYDAQGRALDSDENTAGTVPLVVVEGSKTRLPIEDIADANRRLYNVDSQRDEILVNLTFPQPYVHSDLDGDSGEEQQAVEIGTRRMLLVPPGVTQPPGFVSPPSDPVVQHREERGALRAQIYELAGLERKDPDSQTVQSGVAKAYDFRETAARLVNAAALVESVEQRVFSLLSAFGVAGEWNVTYAKDFDARAFESRLASYLQLADAPLPAEVKKLAAKDLTNALVEERTDEEKSAALDAVDAMGPADFGAPQPSLLDRLELQS